MDIVNGGVGVSENNYSFGVVGDDGGIGEEYIDMVLEDGFIVIYNSVMFFVNVFIFVSQDSLVDGKVVVFNGNQMVICGDVVINSYSDDIIRYKFVGFDMRDMVVVLDYVGFVGRVFLEGSNGFFGVVFLGDINDCIENENCKNLQRIDGLMVLFDFGYMCLGGQGIGEVDFDL